MPNKIRRERKDWGVGEPKYNQDDLMTKEEIHDFALRVLFDYVKEENYEILRVNTEYGFNPSFVCKKNDTIYALIVKSNIAPIHPALTISERQQAYEFCLENKMVPFFCPVSFGSIDAFRFDKGIALVGDGYYCNFKGFEEITDFRS